MHNARVALAKFEEAVQRQFRPTNQVCPGVFPKDRRKTRNTHQREETWSLNCKCLHKKSDTKWASDKIKEAAARADDPSKVWELPALAARGEQIYTANCQVCHQPNGKGGGNIKALDGSPTVLDADKTKQIHVLLNGQNNGAMPSWKQHSDTEIAAVITFTKNHWSNNTGQIVQPSEVAAARK